ncbi:MAG: acyltransferase family protein [Hoeflea sp.]|uniref:acyltransferase family protein n=1 Tax=Hoeflea sp. TaxID=1940281 RepID=UPI0032EEDEA9
MRSTTEPDRGRPVGGIAGSTRLHHWDFARALYLALGIPFHAAVIYSLNHEWAVGSPGKSQALTWLADFIHTFRMPGFFLLAGLFSMMLIERKGAWSWLKSRLFRLGLPLLSATLLILPLQIVISGAADVANGAMPLANLGPHLAGELTRFGEPWISHLWFLWVLIAYCIGLAVLEWLSRGTLARRLDGLVEWIAENRILSLAAFAAICELSARAQEIVVAASPYYGNAVINYNLYVVYFAFGAAVQSSGRLNALLLRPGPLAALAGAVLVILSQGGWSNLFVHTLKVMAGIAGALLIVGFISNLAHRHCNRPDARVRKLVEASFTVYLFHHPVIMALAALFLFTDLPPVLEFAIIATSAGLISYAIHLAVSRSPAAMLMFNGVRAGALPASSRADALEPKSIPGPGAHSLRG